MYTHTAKVFKMIISSSCEDEEQLELSDTAGGHLNAKKLQPLWKTVS